MRNNSRMQTLSVADGTACLLTTTNKLGQASSLCWTKRGQTITARGQVIAIAGPRNNHSGAKRVQAMATSDLGITIRLNYKDRGAKRDQGNNHNGTNGAQHWSERSSGHKAIAIGAMEKTKPPE